jgi:hypothetical protein
METERGWGEREMNGIRECVAARIVKDIQPYIYKESQLEKHWY